MSKCNHEFAIGFGDMCIRCSCFYAFLNGEYYRQMTIEEMLNEHRT
jgi:hypothetical protein